MGDRVGIAVGIAPPSQCKACHLSLWGILDKKQIFLGIKGPPRPITAHFPMESMQGLQGRSRPGGGPWRDPGQKIRDPKVGSHGLGLWLGVAGGRSGIRWPQILDLKTQYQPCQIGEARVSSPLFQSLKTPWVRPPRRSFGAGAVGVAPPHRGQAGRGCSSSAGGRFHRSPCPGPRRH